ncbi:unnamed protein product [Pleuronectes platessa]|uniref:Uncharacterized protein n=1 Tax=Pleuronectes platessa TaxID=8262 RepID=A0A9N7YPI5_PLEPL|nr:unnamed protein product [Pleuronectes platessa]
MCELTSEKNSVHRRLIDSVLVEDTVFSLLLSDDHHHSFLQGMLTTLSDLPNEEKKKKKKKKLFLSPVPRECLPPQRGCALPARFGRGDWKLCSWSRFIPSHVRAPAPEGRLLSGCCVN